MFSNTANNSGAISFSEDTLRRVLASKEGRQLLALLQRTDGDSLRKAVDAVRAGDYDRAKELLSPMLRGTEAENLLGRLGNG